MRCDQFTVKIGKKRRVLFCCRGFRDAEFTHSWPVSYLQTFSERDLGHPSESDPTRRRDGAFPAVSSLKYVIDDDVESIFPLWCLGRITSSVGAQSVMSS